MRCCALWVWSNSSGRFRRFGPRADGKQRRRERLLAEMGRGVHLAQKIAARSDAMNQLGGQRFVVDHPGRANRASHIRDQLVVDHQLQRRKGDGIFQVPHRSNPHRARQHRQQHGGDLFRPGVLVAITTIGFAAVDARGAAVVFAEQLHAGHQQITAVGAAILEQPAAHISVGRRDIHGHHGVVADRIAERHTRQGLGGPQGQQAGRRDRGRRAAGRHGVDRLRHAELQVFQEHLNHVSVETQGRAYFTIADEHRIAAILLGGAGHDLADFVNPPHVFLGHRFNAAEFLGPLHQFRRHDHRTVRRRHRLIGHRQTGVVDMLQVVDHVDGAEHVVAAGWPPAAVRVVEKAAESARADREICVYLIGGRSKTHMGKPHRHALRPIRTLIVLPHLRDDLPADLAGNLDQAGGVVDLTSKPLQVAERLGRIDLDSRPLQDRLGRIVDPLHLRGGEDPERFHDCSWEVGRVVHWLEHGVNSHASSKLDSDKSTEKQLPVSHPHGQQSTRRGLLPCLAHPEMSIL